MKKNLKKVISAVLSLALTASCFTAMSVSAKFSDVEDTASYAEAVNALQALGAIAGYEDGTFQADKNITRAESATMIVAALNKTADAKAAGSVTQFDDVNDPSSNWAAGYVNVGVANGYISGRTATEFAPKDDVSFADMCTMLTRILGYGDYAESKGGYPNGYITAASSAGILTGVSAAAGAKLTRGQVAQLLWNAIQAPMLDTMTFSANPDNNEMIKMDGNYVNGFKTVLSENWDAYVFNAKVTSTAKSDNSLEAGTVKLIYTTGADWAADYELLVKNIGGGVIPVQGDVYVGNTDIADRLHQSVKVLASYVDDDWTVIYVNATSKISTKAVDGTLVSAATTADQLQIRKDKNSTTTTKYKLTPDVMVYINGVLVDMTTGGALDPVKLCAALDGSNGDTVLYESDSRTGYYDVIMMNCYLTAEVNQVTVRDDEVTVNLKSLSGYDRANSGTSFTVTDDELDDGDVEVSVTRNGEAADLASLEKGDVVSILYDAAETLDDSSFLTILATNETVTGRFDSYDSDDDVYTIEDKGYDAVANLGSILVGTTYTFKLDVFGNLFSADEEDSAWTYAIVEKYVDAGNTNYEGSETNDYVVVKTLDGQEKTIYVDSAAKTTVHNVMYGIKNFTGSTLRLDNNSVEIKDRIIQYQTKKNGYINKFALAATLEQTANYVEASNRLGKSLSDSVTVLDASDYVNAAADDKKLADIKASSVSELRDGTEYEAVLVNKNTNNEYMYVIITKNGEIFDGASNFAVVAADASRNSRGHSATADEDCYTMTAMYEGNMQTLEIADTAKVYYNGSDYSYDDAISNNWLKQASVFYFTKDADGLIDEIDVVFKGGALSFAGLLGTTTTDALATLKMPRTENIADKTWKATLDEDDGFFDGEENIQLLVAPVYNAKSSSVSVAEVESGSPYYMNCDKTYDFSVSGDAYIYSFDMSGKKIGKNAFSTGAFSGVSAKDADESNYIYFGSHSDDLDYSSQVQFAFMMVVDGVVTNAVVMQDTSFRWPN